MENQVQPKGIQQASGGCLGQAQKFGFAAAEKQGRSNQQRIPN